MTNTITLAARKYGWKYSGMLGFLIQRITAIGLLAYLFLHVHTIHMMNNPQEFDKALDQFRQPLFKLGEITLLGVVILNALNGIRLTAVDLRVGLSKHGQMFWYFGFGFGAIVSLAGAIPIFIHPALH